MTNERSRALLVYASVDGQTEKIVRRIADRLRERDVAAVERALETIDSDRPLPGDGPVVVAAPVRFERHPKAVERFVRARRAELTERASVFLSVSGSAGSPDPEHRAAAASYVERFLARTGWRPDETAAVAGAVRYTRYNPILRWVMKRINVKGGHVDDTDTSRDYEYTDWEQVDGIADRLAAASAAAPEPASG